MRRIEHLIGEPGLDPTTFSRWAAAPPLASRRHLGATALPVQGWRAVVVVARSGARYGPPDRKRRPKSGKLPTRDAVEAG